MRNKNKTEKKLKHNYKKCSYTLVQEIWWMDHYHTRTTKMIQNQKECYN